MKNKKIQQLEQRMDWLQNHLDLLQETVEMLMDGVTRPDAQTTSQPVDYRRKPRTRVMTANRMKVWTDEDVQIAMQLRAKGATWAQIGKVLGRTGRAVQSLLARRGLL